MVPLRKRGESANTLDYRSISLLQTGYTTLAKILATRLQSLLGKLIGETQQGFVMGRRMDKEVVFMMAALENNTQIDTQDTEHKPGILFLFCYFLLRHMTP